MIFEGKWILKASLLHPILQENVWLNSTRPYIYVNEGKREGIQSMGWGVIKRKVA